MHDRGVDDAPPCLRLFDDGLECLLGHARIVFELERRHVRVLVHITHQPEETDDSTDAGIAVAQGLELDRNVEVLDLNADAHDLSLRSPAATARLHPRARSWTLI